MAKSSLGLHGSVDPPITFTGYGDEYDEKGNIISHNTKVITSKTGEDANSYVDPGKVAAAVIDLDTTVAAGIDEIKGKLKNVSVGADGKMLMVEDVTMKPVINEAADSLDTIMPSLESGFQEIIDFAVGEHNKKQLEYNQVAYDAVSGTSGVNVVSPSRP